MGLFQVPIFSTSSVLWMTNILGIHERDLEHMSERLVGAVDESMQPAHFSLWIRPGGKQDTGVFTRSATLCHLGDGKACLSRRTVGMPQLSALVSSEAGVLALIHASMVPRNQSLMASI
jgi:hypothetical protein